MPQDTNVENLIINKLTNAQYLSAKCMYYMTGNIETLLSEV